MDAFDTPRVQYDNVRKTFYTVPHKRPLHGSAEQKGDLLRDRFQLLHQRMLRNDLFSPPAVSAGPHIKQDYYKITQIESLIGTPGHKCIFGMLTSMVEGKYHIEDPEAFVEVDISEAQITSGLFTENCMVLAEGELIEGVFHVSTLGFPPCENRRDTLEAFAKLDCFGLDYQGHEKEKEKVELRKLLEEEKADDMIIIVSDVHLDKMAVMEKLRLLFSGYDGMVGSANLMFVFMGNFTSKSMVSSPTDMKALKGYFDALCDLIMDFPEIPKCQFVFVPGPLDPGIGNVLPKPPLASIFTDKLQRKLGDRVRFGSNPCRILYCTQEIVLFREDLVHKLRRNVVISPTLDEISDLSEHVVKTVCDQAHLCPLNLATRPIYWNYDHALRLYPLPHALVLADVVDQFEWTYEGCEAFNPGCFSSDFSFVVYWPGKNKPEFSRVG